jgi:adenylosuccinate lyase
MATENILMEAVKRGGDRQELHERIRVHSVEAARMVKEMGQANDLIQRIADDPVFGMSLEELNAILSPENFIGRCIEQVTEFLSQEVYPLLKKNNVVEETIELKA